MAIRKPLSRRWRTFLGVCSIAVLMLAYGTLAVQRQSAKRSAAREQLSEAEAALATIKEEIAASERGSEASPTSIRRPLENKLLQQNRLVERLSSDAEGGLDRSVPTWQSLYREGLLRVLRPEGLEKDEYWLWEDSIASFRRLFTGLGVGILLSIAVGLLMGCYSPIDAVLLPPLSFLSKIPPTAMLAVFFVLVGTGFEMYITMLAFGTLPTLAQSISQSVKNDVPDELAYKAATLGASQMELIFSVILRQILPRMLDAIRLQVGPAMVLLVAAEWMVAGEGFGYRLRLFFQRTDMTVVFVYVAILGIFGLALDSGLTWLRRWLCPWFGD